MVEHPDKTSPGTTHTSSTPRLHLTYYAIASQNDEAEMVRPSLATLYRGHEWKIESKSLQTARNKTLGDGSFAGVSQVDASDRRTVTLPDGSQLQTTCLVVGEFDVLAVNCFSFENKWRFVFARNRDLPRSSFRSYSPEQRLHLLATLVPVVWPPKGIFRADVFSLLDEMIKARLRGSGSLGARAFQPA